MWKKEVIVENIKVVVIERKGVASQVEIEMNLVIFEAVKSLKYLGRLVVFFFFVKTKIH